MSFIRVDPFNLLKIINSQIKHLLKIKGRRLLSYSKNLVYEMIRDDSSMGYLSSCKYNKSESKSQTRLLLLFQSNSDLPILSQTVSDNLTTLYTDKIRLLEESAKTVWQEEYLIRSGFAEDVWRYLRH